jgi:ubiquitin C-terminal hydrolase
VLFEAIETALSGTAYDSLIQELYFGHQNTVITCTLCNQSRKRPERFLDLMLSVKNNKGVEQALEQLFTFEELDGVECETCQSKTTQFKGPRISRLPPVLTFCLNRIELDYTTWERKKINDRFEYPLELDMRNYIDQDPDC